MCRIFLTLLVATLGVAAGFSQDFTDGEWSYALSANNEATIVRYNGAGGVVEVPANVGGYPVKIVGLDYTTVLYPNNTSVTSLTIPSGVTRIGIGAFSDASSLTSVTIPDSVRSIGAMAFIYCSALTSVSMGNGLAVIGDDAFKYCAGLTNVSVPDSVTSIGNKAFLGCSSLTNVTFGDSIASIGYAAFSSTRVTNVTLPFFTSLGVEAFGTEPSSVVVNRDFTVLTRNEAFLRSLSQNEWFINIIATNESFVTGVATVIVASLPNNYGIAIKDDLLAVVSNTITQIQSNPSTYNLFTPAQNEARYNEGVTAGTSMVTGNPASYNLYTSNSIMDLRMNGAMVQKQGETATVVFQPQTTMDLATQPFTDNGPAITNEIPMPGDKGFLRIQAKPQ